MPTRLVVYSVGFCVVAGMLAVIACPHVSKPTPPSPSASLTSAASSEEIQSKAAVFDLPDPSSFTRVGIMGAYDPKSHAFWWRSVPFIAEPSMLEAYFERCKFLMAGERLLNVCVRGNEVVVTTTGDYAQSLDQGLAGAQSRLRTTPDLLMSYRGPRDTGFNLQQKAGVDMNTAEGVPPTVVRSVRKTAEGWELNVTCGCGDALISVDNNFDFIGLKRN
jgi:hypothetical protein